VESARAYSKRSQRAQLQRALGDAGEVLARVERGSTNRPAQGWYAVVKGEEVFLGDHVAVGFVTIARMLNGSGP
jgi:hypothetical protein